MSKSSEYWRRINARRRARWKKEGKCAAHGITKPCYKCREFSQKYRDQAKGLSGFCEECIHGGGGHFPDCRLLLKSRDCFSKAV